MMSAKRDNKKQQNARNGEKICCFVTFAVSASGQQAGVPVSKKLKRRHMIEQIVHERGTVSVGALAEMLDVSMQTIRRDLDRLSGSEALRRLHGRVELSEGRRNTPFDLRAGTNLAGKEAIGAAAAALIPDGATLFVSIGSTPLAVARALRARRELTVITNNLRVAMTLADEESNRIVLPGGEMRLPDRDIIGVDVTAFFGRYRADFALFGTAGVAEDGGLLEFHAAEVSACEQMRHNARRSILVIDRSKFGRSAPALGGNIAGLDHVVTDLPPSGDYLRLLRQLGPRVIFAQRGEA